ncbi:DUF6446 family protein [Nereida sp. MMG025]|uniref:DUF6446 family protein n=1 Tax=Nereida sp. MMG025 TaxID=2909981 RepID=UPI001F2298C9|nr:DUF6446 family protein [Nereida sp. MMG025]MCF6443792.1 DUF6446 family protein [Nereida sp. MMG025]
MNPAKIAIGGIVVSALAAGIALYYLQVYAFYDEVSSDAEDVRLTTYATQAPEPIPFDNFQGIDANSSPLRYRACFTTPLSDALLTETYVSIENAEPRTAPSWFDCFDAEAIGAALEDGQAFAYMGTENITYGIDRIVAIFPDGRGYAWHQINACGEVVFDGRRPPENCPPAPESLQ